MCTTYAVYVVCAVYAVNTIEYSVYGEYGVCSVAVCMKRIWYDNFSF